MKVSYNTKGTCSQVIEFEINDGIIDNVSFKGGCNGNLKAISKLVNGKNANRRSKLTDGDTVVLMSPVAGG